MAETKEEIAARVTRRGERIRGELADVLARAREPTTAAEACEQMPADVDRIEAAFQLDRMAEEGRAMKVGDGYSAAEPVE